MSSQYFLLFDFKLSLYVFIYLSSKYMFIGLSLTTEEGRERKIKNMQHNYQKSLAKQL